jgi:hypothetical protein
MGARYSARCRWGTPIFTRYLPNFGRGGTDVALHARVAAQNPDHQKKRKARGDEMDRTTAALFHPQPELWLIGWSSGVSPCWSDLRVTIATLSCRTLEHLKRSEK